ncbi:hypothetical protein AB1N83_010559 [Pleurotus pulmonarius]
MHYISTLSPAIPGASKNTLRPISRSERPGWMWETPEPSPIAMRTASVDLPLSRRAPSSWCARHTPISAVRASFAHLLWLELFKFTPSAPVLPPLHDTI